MASPNDKSPGNVDGPWCVTTDCIACGLCLDIAPGVFSLDANEGYAFVSRQPQGDEEAEVEEAADECPVDAIVKAD